MVVVQLIVLSQDIQVCRKCGIVFDLNMRENKDCPLCSAGEHTELKMNNNVPRNPYYSLFLLCQVLLFPLLAFPLADLHLHRNPLPVHKQIASQLFSF